MKIEFDPKKGR